MLFVQREARRIKHVISVPEEERAAKSAKPKEPAFYAVQRGNKPGVYGTWAECQEQIAGFKGAKYKKFDTEEEADAFAKGTWKTPTKATRQIGVFLAAFLL